MKLDKFEDELDDLVNDAKRKAGKKGSATIEQLATSLIVASHALVPPETSGFAQDVGPLDGLAAVLHRPVAKGECYLVRVDADGEGFTVEETSGVTPAEVRSGLEAAAELVAGYAKLHLAKSPPDIDKAERNSRMAERLYGLLGIDYEWPEIPAQEPQENDSGRSGAPVAPKIAAAPMDRAEVVAWMTMKLDGLTKKGMSESYNVVRAIRDEIAQHIEAAPIDFQVALAAFYKDVYERNVKAGWWTDLATQQPKKRSVGELFILFVTELWEAYDAYIESAADDKLPHLPGLVVELADLQIRFADFAGALLAGNIVRYTGAKNPGDLLFQKIGSLAIEYERIRKTPEAIGEPEMGDLLPPDDVASAVVQKLEFNATRADHKIENRMKADGKRT